MTLKFIIDTQLPPLLSRQLTEKGFDSIHTVDCPNGIFTSDTEIRRIAVSENRIIITKDSDFHDYYVMKGAPPKVLLLKIGNCNNQELSETIFSRFDKLIHYFDQQNEAFVILTKNFIAVI